MMAALFYYSCVSGQRKDIEAHIVEELHEVDNDANYVSELEQAIVGEWVNVSMRVWVKSYNNSDTSFIVDISEENWEMKMNIKPIVTTIYPNGTYISEFRNSFDSLIYMPEGTWLTDGDTLLMQDHQATYKYQIFLDGNRAEFNSLIDWDNDGLADDEYQGVQRKNK